MGMGFPPYRGGLMHWADSLGSKHIAKRLREWSRQFGAMYEPCDYLRDLAERGEKLSG